MNHSRHLSAVFRPDGNTVAAVSHGDHGILEIRADGTVYHRGELCVYPVIGLAHGAAQTEQSGAGIIA